jgi:hypothetical protein
MHCSGMREDSVNEELEFAGEKYVSIWHLLGLKIPADQMILRCPRLWPSFWATILFKNNFERAAAAKRMDYPHRLTATAYLHSRLRISKVLGLRLLLAPDSRKHRNDVGITDILPIRV